MIKKSHIYLFSIFYVHVTCGCTVVLFIITIKQDLFKVKQVLFFYRPIFLQDLSMFIFRGEQGFQINIFQLENLS